MGTFRSVQGVRIALATALGISSSSCGGRAIAVSSDAGGGGPVTSETGGSAAATATPAARPPIAANGDVEDAAPPSHSPRFPCIDPVPLIVGRVDTGYDVCQGGTLRRRAIVDCPHVLPRDGGGTCPPNITDLPGTQGCHSDSDCTMHPFGTCGVGQAGCQCEYGCQRDSDCMTGNICVCGDPVGECEPASCNAGTCPAGLECVDYVVNPGCPGNAFACQTATDTCLTSSDCPTGQSCTLAGGDGSYIASSGPRACARAGCSVGRPFLVGDEARLPSVRERADWCAREIGAVAASLPVETRARLGDAWLAIARMEHASIAAFARFALQLLAVGAPPDLVLAAQRAMADETRHAQLAFSLASACSGRDLGPGPLAIDACLDETDLPALVASVFVEGCVGETLAAVEAREALEHAHDPAVVAVLKTIAEDETRHAELAWRTTAWAVAVGGDAVRKRLETAVATEMQEAHAASDGDPAADEDLLAHGIVGDSLRRRLRAAVLADVVGPGVRQLLAAWPGNRAARVRKLDARDLV